MAATVAGEVLGPRPGLAIVSFPQGILEIVLRVAAAVNELYVFMGSVVNN